MEYTVGTAGRVIVARLHDGEAIYPAIEGIASGEKINSAVVWVIGGVKNGQVVVGPKDPSARPLETLRETFTDAREILGAGTLFLNAQGKPSLHMHAAIGKGDSPIVGCPRLGADCWLVNEVVILEIAGANARRIKKPDDSLELLEIG